MSLDEWVGYGIPEEVIKAALKWLARLDTQQISEIEQQEFFRWLDEDPTHRWAFEELSEIWAKTSILKDQEHLIEKSQVLYFPTPTNENLANVDQVSNWLHYWTIILIFVGMLVPFAF